MVTWRNRAFLAAVSGAALTVGLAACGGSTSGATGDGGTGGDSASNGTGTAGTAGTGGTGGTGTGGSAGTGGTNGTSGTGGTSSDPPPTCGGAHGTPAGRPSALACAPTTGFPGEFADGAPSCTDVADCADAGAVFAIAACLRGQCSIDECYADSDCPSGSLCACASEFGGGSRVPSNMCMATQCRLDSDCGQGEVCSPSYGGGCATLQGFYCHTSADECLTNSDCCESTPTCGYEPSLGHWACQQATICAG